jgi:hypothetical protein
MNAMPHPIVAPPPVGGVPRKGRALTDAGT